MNIPKRKIIQTEQTQVSQMNQSMLQLSQTNPIHPPSPQKKSCFYNQNKALDSIPLHMSV